MSKKTSLFGVLVDDITMSETLNLSKQVLFGKESRQIAVYTPNLEMLEAARRSKEIRELLNSADLLLPDGVGVSLIAGLLGKGVSETVSGIDFGERLFQTVRTENVRVFLLGGKEGVAETASWRLRERFAGLEICGYHHGYLNTTSETDALLSEIDRSRAEILIVCMGFPLQERFVRSYRPLLPSVKIFACLGGALDVWSGNAVRAPYLLRELRAEWLWRVLAEPNRLPRLVSSLPAIPAAISSYLKKGIAKRH